MNGPRLVRVMVRTAPAFAVFAAGGLGMYLLDVIMAAQASTDNLVAWTQLKSVVFLVGGIGLLGMDQLAVREPEGRARFVRIGVASAVTSATLAAAWLVASHSASLAASAFWCALLFALSYYSFGVARGAHKPILAHLARDGWKVIALVILGVSLLVGQSPDMIWWLPVALTATLPLQLLAATTPLVARTNTGRKLEIQSDWNAVRMGLPFALSAASLAIGSYGELIVLNAMADDAAVARYFRAAVIFGYPSLLLTTFIGGILSAKFRDRPELFEKVAMTSPILIAAAVAAISGTTFVLGAGVVWWWAGKATTELLVAGSLLAISGGARLVAVVCTAGLGVLATRSTLDKQSALYAVGAFAMIGALAAAISLGKSPEIAAAGCVSGYWTFRLLVGLWFSRAHQTAARNAIHQ